MTNEVIDGIVAALNAEFDPIPVYTEEVEQGLVEPSFSVRCINDKFSHFRGDRYFRESLFEILYFPPEDSRKNNSNGVVQRLFLCLEYIRAGNDILRGTKMDSHMEDGVIIFTLHYDYFVIRTSDGDKMETLTVRINGTDFEIASLTDEQISSLADERLRLLLDNQKAGGLHG